MAQAFTESELAEMGAFVVALCGTYQSLGHVCAVGTVQDYAARPDGHAGFVWDMFAACSLDSAHNAEPRARLGEFTDQHRLLDLIAEAAAR